MKRNYSENFSWKRTKECDDIGLKKGQIFPEVIVYCPKNKSDKLLSSFFPAGKKTIIVRQPGFTPTEGYWGEKHDKQTWISNPGAAGCGAHTDGWIAQYEAFQKAGNEVVLLTSEKTPEEWEQMLTSKSIPFPVVSLSKNSIDILLAQQAELDFAHPSFLFEDKTILCRANWIVDNTGKILEVQDNSHLKPEECSKDALAMYQLSVSLQQSSQFQCG